MSDQRESNYDSNGYTAAVKKVSLEKKSTPRTENLPHAEEDKTKRKSKCNVAPLPDFLRISEQISLGEKSKSTVPSLPDYLTAPERIPLDKKLTPVAPSLIENLSQVEEVALQVESSPITENLPQVEEVALQVESSPITENLPQVKKVSLEKESSPITENLPHAKENKSERKSNYTVAPLPDFLRISEQISLGKESRSTVPSLPDYLAAPEPIPLEAKLTTVLPTLEEELSPAEEIPQEESVAPPLEEELSPAKEIPQEESVAPPLEEDLSPAKEIPQEKSIASSLMEELARVRELEPKEESVAPPLMEDLPHAKEIPPQEDSIPVISSPSNKSKQNDSKLSRIARIKNKFFKKPYIVAGAAVVLLAIFGLKHFTGNPPESSEQPPQHVEPVTAVEEVKPPEVPVVAEQIPAEEVDDSFDRSRQFYREAEIARQTFMTYYRAIISEDYETAYAMLTPEQKSRVGGFDSYVNSRSRMLNGVMTDVYTMDSSAESVTIGYRFTVDDKLEGDKLRTQIFKGEVTLVERGGDWYIFKDKSRKAEELVKWNT